jgi:hypothetical protein
LSTESIKYSKTHSAGPSGLGQSITGCKDNKSGTKKAVTEKQKTTKRPQGRKPRRKTQKNYNIRK